MMQPVKKLHPAIATLIVIVLVGIVVTATIVINAQSSSDSSTSIPATTQAAQTASSSTPTGTATNYKDGTYSATGSYSTPGGRESIGLTVTIANGVITSTSLDVNSRSGESRSYQRDFAAGYKSLVVGKNVNDVSLSRVAGASLTTNGFETALEQIKSDAKT